MTQKIHPVDKHVGEKIREAREHQGLTLREFAKQTDVSAQQIQKYETGFNKISPGRLFDISEILDFPIAHFFPYQHDWIKERVHDT